MLGSYRSEPLPGPVTGGGNTFSGNTIRPLTDDTGSYGLIAWAGAHDVTVAHNLITGMHEAVSLKSGGSYVVVDNTLGTAEVPVGQWHQGLRRRRPDI